MPTDETTTHPSPQNAFGVKMEAFEGPLHLLLELIESQELDISKVSLSQVADQYILYIETLEESSPEDIADFLVIAARLLYIKSKTLLPAIVFEEDEEGDLETQLKIYREYLEASKRIEVILKKKRFSFFREKTFFAEPVFHPPKRFGTGDMRELFAGILGRLEPIVKLPQRTLKRTVSIKEKIFEIRNLILKKSRLAFHELLKDSNDRTEKIVSFLALLELVKQRDIRVEQPSLFEPISISKY